MKNRQSHWEEFKKEKKDLYPILIKNIDVLNENPQEDNFRKAYLAIRGEDIPKEDLMGLYNGLGLLSDQFSFDVNWWDQFAMDNALDKKFQELIYLIIDQGKETTEKGLEDLKKKIEKAKKNLSKEEKEKLQVIERRFGILENRVGRQVSHTFGTILKSLRTERDLSLLKLGELAGVSPSYINRIEQGKRLAPSYPILEQLAKALDVDMAMLLMAAGSTKKQQDAKSIKELLYSHNVKMTPDSEPIDADKKELVSQILAFMENSKWTPESKTIESIQLIGMIDEYKKA